MTTWHRAKIKFQYSPKDIPSHRVMNSVTTQVYGNTESAALQALRKMYPSWQDFVILELDWDNQSLKLKVEKQRLKSRISIYLLNQAVLKKLSEGIYHFKYLRSSENEIYF